MSLLFRRREAPVEERQTRIAVADGSGWFWSAGQLLESNPMRSVAHAAARMVLCRAVASMPVDQFRKQGRRRVEMTPSRVVDSPSATVDQQTWVYQVIDSWLESGNVWGDVVATDSMGLPTQVEIIAPSKVAIISGVPTIGGVERKLWPLGDLWHASYEPQAGSRFGRSPADRVAPSVQTSLAAEKFGGDFFAASGHPTYDIQASVPLNKEQAQAVKEGFLASVQGRLPWVHGSDLSAKPMNVDPKSSQFIELLQFECLQAARTYLVPPSMIYAAVSGSNVTYSNITQDDLSFLKWSVRWPMRRLEAEWSRWLPRPQFVKLNVDAMLEMTPRERAEVNEIRLRSKTVTVNEVREKEDQEPFGAEFDAPGIPG